MAKNFPNNTLAKISVSHFLIVVDLWEPGDAILQKEADPVWGWNQPAEDSRGKRCKELGLSFYHSVN